MQEAMEPRCPSGENLLTVAIVPGSDTYTMAQVKKPWVREAILHAAQELFRRQTYQGTTLVQIAKAAGTSSATLYVYFASKLEILYAVYEPWVRGRLALLEAKVQTVQSPLERLRIILNALWKEIPAEENGFVRNIVQALATAGSDESYDSTLLDWMEEQINRMLFGALPVERRKLIFETRLTHLFVMTLDGYAIHGQINPRGVVDDATIDAMAKLLLGESPMRERRGRAARTPPQDVGPSP